MKRPLLKFLLLGMTMACSLSAFCQQSTIRLDTTYFEDGPIQSIYAYDSLGHRTGLQRTYYPNGYLKTEYRMQASILHGPFERFFPSGERHLLFNYVDGKKQMDQTVWESDRVVFQSIIIDSLQREQVIDQSKVAAEWVPRYDEFIFAEQKPTALNADEVFQQIISPIDPDNPSWEVVVVLRVLVSQEGKLLYAKGIGSAPLKWKNAVEPLVYDLNFSPAIQGGKPIPFWVNVPFRFRPKP